MMAWRRIVLLFVFFHLATSLPAFSQKIVNQFAAPGDRSRGLAWDGTYLWCADEIDKKIYKLNPSTGEVISSISFTVQYDKGGLTWSSDGNIWIANGLHAYKLHPNTGDTMATFQCPGS